MSLLLLFLAGWANQGLAYNNGAPTMDCFRCHAAVGDQESSLRVTGLPEAFVPGKTYRFKVAVESSQASLGEVQGGFAVEISAGELRVVDKRHTQISSGIATHTQEGSALRVWEVSWRAPREKKPVELTIMAVAANGDFAPVGDPVAAELYTLMPKK